MINSYTARANNCAAFKAIAAIGRYCLVALWLFGGAILWFGDPVFAQDDEDGLFEAKEKEEHDKDKKKWETERMKKYKGQDITNSVKVEDIVESSTEYHYAGFNKEDPFVPPLMATKPAKEVDIYPEEIPVVSQLQKFSWGQLKISGIWQTSTGERKALVMTPDNIGVIARVGDSLGNSGGKIVDITNDTAVVREYRLLPDGTREFEDRLLRLGSLNKQERDEQTRQPIVLKAQKGAARNIEDVKNSVLTEPNFPAASQVPEYLDLIPPLGKSINASPASLPPPTNGPAAAAPIPAPGPSSQATGQSAVTSPQPSPTPVGGGATPTVLYNSIPLPVPKG